MAIRLWRELCPKAAGLSNIYPNVNRRMLSKNSRLHAA